MPETVPPIDLSDLSSNDYFARLGELVHASLERSGVCVLLSRGDREVTFVQPFVLDEVTDDALADSLLGAWTDEEILAFLSTRRGRAR